MSGNFIDYVKIYCRSGKGGAGCMHLHRAKYLPKGGPDGGDGGKGGSIILRGNRNLWTLLHLKYQKHIMATDGGRGGQSRSFGKDGEDRIIEVPCGTVVYDGETGEWLCEVKEHDERIVLLKGGRGGLGNWHFRTATNQAPRYAQPGEPAQERTVIMQLKVLADVQGARSRNVKYRSHPGGFLTRPRNPGRRQCQGVSLTGAVSSQTATEEFEGQLSTVGNRASSARVEAGLTARRTRRADAKAGPSDPAVHCGMAVAQRIKGTLGITG